MAFLTASGRHLEYQTIPGSHPHAPWLVFLHEGLGSVALWRDFPWRVARATGCRALAYSRYGYGRSDAFETPLDPDYMHREALEALPEILEQLGIDRPILIGHSDGGSIALIHAGASGRPVRALVLLAPHVFVEEETLAGIRAAKETYRATDLAFRLGRYHADPDKTFWGWNNAWLSGAFRFWNIEEFLPAIRCPFLLIQGEQDEYGTEAQLDAILAQASGPGEKLMLPDCGHSPHRDQEDRVLAATTAFIERLR